MARDNSDWYICWLRAGPDAGRLLAVWGALLICPQPPFPGGLDAVKDKATVVWDVGSLQGGFDTMGCPHEIFIVKRRG